MFDIEQSIQAQEKLCETRGVPLFAPLRGVCYKCFENIYSPIEKKGWNGRPYTTGIDTEKAGKSHITYCPHCNKSFCD